MYAKMLNETENEETRLFWQIFVIGGILIKGTRVPSAMWTKNRIKLVAGINVIAAFLCFRMLKRKIFVTKCNKCCFADFAFDIDFGSLATTAFSSFCCKNKNNFIKLRGTFLRSLKTSYIQ